MSATKTVYTIQVLHTHDTDSPKYTPYAPNETKFTDGPDWVTLWQYGSSGIPIAILESSDYGYMKGRFEEIVREGSEGIWEGDMSQIRLAKREVGEWVGAGL